MWHRLLQIPLPHLKSNQIWTGYLPLHSLGKTPDYILKKQIFAAFILLAENSSPFFALKFYSHYRQIWKIIFIGKRQAAVIAQRQSSPCHLYHQNFNKK